MLENIKKIILLTALIIMGGLIFGQEAGAALTLAQLQSRAKIECDSFVRSTLKKYLADLSSAGKYQNLIDDIRINDFILPAVKDTFKVGVDVNYGVLLNSCSVIDGAATAAAAQADYDNLLERKKIILPILNKISALDNFYGRFQASGKNYLYLSALAKDNDFHALLVIFFPADASSVDQALAASAADFSAITRNLPPAAWYYDLFALDQTALNDSVNDLNSKLALGNKRLSDINSNYSQAYKKIYQAMDLTAQLGIIKSNNDIYQTYQKLYDSYAAKSLSSLNSLRSKIKTLAATLNNKKNQFAPNGKTKALAGLTPAVASYLIGQINKALNDLSDLSGQTSAGLNYKTALERKNDLDDLKISTVVIPNLNAAGNFSRSYSQASSSAAVYQRFNASYNDLYANLNTGGQTKLAILKQTFNDINANYLTALLGNDKTKIEQKIIDNTGSWPDLAVLNSLINNYNRKLANANSRLALARGDWWQLIAQAAAKSFLTDFSNLTWLAQEKKAQVIVNDFASQRDRRLQQAQKIIENRKKVIADNLLIINGLSYIPVSIKTKVNLADYSRLLIADLADYYDTQISPVQNYNDLTAGVSGVRNFKLKEVFIPLEKIYAEGNDYYRQYQILTAALTDDNSGLTARISALENNVVAGQRQAGVTLRAVYLEILNNDLAPLKTNMDNLLTVDLLDALTANDIALTENVITDAADVKTDLTAIISRVKALLAAVKRAEALK